MGNASGGVGLGDPGGVHLGVVTSPGHQLGMGPDLQESSFTHHHDPVGPHGRAEAVGDAGSAVLPCRRTSRADSILVSDWRSRLDVASSSTSTLGSRHERPGEGHQLSLARRGVDCPRSCTTVSSAFGHPLDHLDQPHWRAPPPRPRRLSASGHVKAMLSRTAGEEERLLGHHARAGGAATRTDSVAQVVAVDEDPTTGGIVKPRHQLRQRRFARPGRPDESDGLAGGDRQIDVGHHRISKGRIRR